MMVTLFCNDPKKKGCHWSGDRQELVALTEDLNDQDFSYCPHCEGNDFEEVEEEDDDE